MLYVVFFCQLKTLKLQQFYQHLNTARFEYKLRNSGKVNDIKQMYNGISNWVILHLVFIKD